jgi:hypothetical protein
LRPVPVVVAPISSTTATRSVSGRPTPVLRDVAEQAVLVPLRGARRIVVDMEREASASDGHLAGLFNRDTWLDLIRGAGLVPVNPKVRDSYTEQHEVFIGRRLR